jgi:hypothetical protein
MLDTRRRICYFGKCETPSAPGDPERGFRRRLRSATWARPGQRKWRSVWFDELRKRGDWAKISPHKRRAALVARGGWRTVQHSASRCPMLTSIRPGFRDELAPDRLNPPNPPYTEPYVRRCNRESGRSTTSVNFGVPWFAATSSSAERSRPSPPWPPGT